MSNKLLITPLFLNDYQITTLINLFRFVPGPSPTPGAPLSWPHTWIWNMYICSQARGAGDGLVTKL